MFVEWNDRVLAAVERRREMSHWVGKGRYSYQTPASLVVLSAASRDDPSLY